jgi:hypothetical protein
MGRRAVNTKETTFQMSTRARVNASMQALIDGFYGCLDSAAEQINARAGASVSKGTISKRLAGQYGWPVEDVIALEDGAGRYPVTKMMMRRLDASKETAAASLYEASGVASKEAGEAISAALSAAQSADAGEIAAAIQEAAEGEAAMRRLREALEARAANMRAGAA